jgi:ribonuclease D
MTVEFEIVDSPRRLEEVIDLVRRADAVAIDTEFARFNTYYPIVGLIQIYDGIQCYLIDPLEVTELGPIADLLEDKSVVKVFHACSEDLEVFQHILEALPVPLFDSQVAAAALGISFSIGYQKLVEHFLDLSISKEETRSDWLQRPLTPAQLEYAALDVIHLLDIYRKQVDELEMRGKLSWVQEECAGMTVSIATELDPQIAYQRLKGTAKLNQESLYLVATLCAWRETKARALDVPRNRLIDEKSVLSLAQLDFLDVGGLHKHTTLTSRQVRQFGDEIILLLESARAKPAAQRPVIVDPEGMPVSNSLMKQLKLKVSETAESVQIAPEMLARRRHLEQILRSGMDTGHYQLPKAMCGWRKTVIGDDLIALLTRQGGALSAV